jgi:heptosyltransferase-2
VIPDAAKCAVIQVKRGIGDVVWHLPFLRAIAAASPGGQVTFLAPPSSGARELLAAEPSVAETIYFEHGGSELRRGLNLIRLAAVLRQHRFRTVWILDRTIRPACAAMLAGIPERIGLGLGPQRLFITNAGIGRGHFHDHPIDWLTALMAATKVPLPTSEPDLRVPAALRTAIAERFGASRRPWIVLGLGSRDPSRDWPNASWAEFVPKLRSRTTGTVFLTGSAADAARAQEFIRQSIGAPAVNQCGLPIGETVALLAQADFYVGPNSGLLHVAAAVATPALGLSGTNVPLIHSRFIHTIEPEGGPSPDGMLRISPAHVLERIAPYLGREKARP